MNNKKGIRLAKVLRHDPSSAGIVLDGNGWAEVSKLLHAMDMTQQELDFIVDTNNKKRFAYNDDKTKIRASQGHSVDVDVELTVADNVPAVLYHGTSTNSVAAILKDGLQKMRRQHVHLSSTEDTAINVGGRHGKPHVFHINAAAMRADGIKIFISANGVYLVDSVDTKYIINA